MRIVDVLQTERNSDLFRQLIDKDILRQEYYRNHLPSAYAAECELCTRGEERLAGYYDFDSFRDAVTLCFRYGVKRLKEDLQQSEFDGKLAYSINDRYFLLMSRTIGPAAIKRGQTVDVYGLHGVELEFVVQDDEVFHTGVRADWGSVDYKVIQSDSVYDISRKRLDDLQDLADDKGYNINQEADINLEK